MNIPLLLITTLTVCLLQVAQAGKPGTCPKVFDIGFSRSCTSDYQCPGNEKCCVEMTGGSGCVQPRDASHGPDGPFEPSRQPRSLAKSHESASRI
uniref:WAP domain-containing protein n=1 Tax=Trichuris muris TaxID=70415 RepID=A0A5S6Q3S2_TRIMR